MEISIPTDNDGFILLRCENCGEFFKITPSDYKDEKTLWIYCPMCGLTSSSYLTSDVIELAKIIIANHIIDELHNSFKRIERSSKRRLIKIKTGGKPKHEYETPVYAGIDALEKMSFQCCSKMAKINPLIKMSGCYCPFCGVNKDGD